MVGPGWPPQPGGNPVTVALRKDALMPAATSAVTAGRMPSDWPAPHARVDEDDYANKCEHIIHVIACICCDSPASWGAIMRKTGIDGTP